MVYKFQKLVHGFQEFWMGKKVGVWETKIPKTTTIIIIHCRIALDVSTVSTQTESINTDVKNDFLTLWHMEAMLHYGSMSSCFSKDNVGMILVLCIDPMDQFMHMEFLGKDTEKSPQMSSKIHGQNEIANSNYRISHCEEQSYMSCFQK